MGMRERMCVRESEREGQRARVISGRLKAEGPKFVFAILQSHRDGLLRSKIQITFSQLSPLGQSDLCGRWSSLLGLTVEATRVSIIVAPPNPV